jgi:hypothetical protein
LQKYKKSFITKLILKLFIELVNFLTISKFSIVYIKTMKTSSIQTMLGYLHNPIKFPYQGMAQQCPSVKDACRKQFCLWINLQTDFLSVWLPETHFMGKIRDKNTLIQVIHSPELC